VRQRGQLHQPDSVGILLYQVRRHLKGQSGLSAATGSGQRQQVGVRQQSLHRGHRLLPPDEARQLHGQVVGERFQGAQGRKVGGKARVEKLEDPLGLLQVLEAVGAQVPQAHASRQMVPHPIGGRLRQQHLTSVGHGA
jgi:hypothetical protein